MSDKWEFTDEEKGFITDGKSLTALQSLKNRSGLDLKQAKVVLDDYNAKVRLGIDQPMQASKFTELVRDLFVKPDRIAALKAIRIRYGFTLKQARVAEMVFTHHDEQVEPFIELCELTLLEETNDVWWSYAVRDDSPAADQDDRLPRYRLLTDALDTREEAVDACKHIPASREPIVVKCERVFPNEKEEDNE